MTTFLLPVIFCLTYIVMLFLFGKFFEQKVKLSKRSIIYIILVFLLSLVSFQITYSIHDIEIGNRVLHFLGGGVLASFLCFLVVIDGKIKISPFQFFVFSFLVVLSLGVFNEILEFFLERYFHAVFAINPRDTWLDLLSNTLGAFVGGVIFTTILIKLNKVL